MEKEAEASPAGPAAQASKKGGKAWITVVGALVIASASSAAGATFGPAVKQKLTGAHPAPNAEEQEEHEPEEKEKGKGHIAALDSLVVDVRDEAADIHHFKIGIALEIPEVVPEEEWKVEVVPRARDATIGYLRALKYEEASNASKLESIRAELQERIAKAVKKPKVRRVLFIDFVVQ